MPNLDDFNAFKTTKSGGGAGCSHLICIVIAIIGLLYILAECSM